MDSKTCENKVDTNTRELKLDDWDICVGNWGHFLDGAWRCHISKDDREIFKEIFAIYMFWDNNKGIDIRA